MRKRSVIINLVVITILLSYALFWLGACSPPEPITEYDFLVETSPISIPSELPDYMLTLEWFDKNGSPTQFVKNKPVMILFNGYSEYDRKESLTLPSDVYNADIISSTILANFNHNLSHYWKKLITNFNVGVFHYESFADDELDKINSKIYSSKDCSYKIDDSILEYADFSLTRAFFSAWKEIADNDLLTGSDGMNLQEVRFIGNSIGANLAISCADYLYAAHDQGLISNDYVPNRVTLTNPWFSNKETMELNIDFREKDSFNSALSYNERRVTELAERGVVFELIEGDKFFFDSYEELYDGCVQIILDEDSEYVWEEGKDTNLYDSMKRNSAYLTFNEAYSQKYPEFYQKYDRGVLDWYLYSAGGSDADFLTSSREGVKPMYDTWGHPSVTHNTSSDSYTGGYSMKYAVSAWTPTIYMRAVRGVEYIMQIYSPSSSYLLDKFQAETRQMSNLNMPNGFFVCGYIYQSNALTSFVDLRPGAGISEFSFSIVATPDGGNSPEQIFLVKTEKDGFYKCLLNEELYSCSININIAAPSASHNFHDKEDVKSGNAWTLCDVNSIGREGINATMFGTEESNFYFIVRNCGFKI